MSKYSKTGFLFTAFLFLITGQSLSQDPFQNGSKRSDLVLFNEMQVCNILTRRSPSSGNIITTLDGTGGHYLYVFNNYGAPLYAKKFPYQIFNLKSQPKGRLSYFDTKVRGYVVIDSTLKTIDTLKMQNGYIAHTHELLMTQNGHYFLFAYDPQLVDMSKIIAGGKEFATVTGLVIQEFNQNGSLVFQWRSWDHFLITDSYADLLQSAIDYVHGNSLFADTDTTLILSSRNLSEVTKINRRTGNIIWRLGGKNNEFTFINDPRKFSKQHTVSRLKNGNLVLFDNGSGLDPVYSRGLEYKIDEKNKNVEFVNEYRHSPDIYTDIKGSAQRLDNGNTFIFWGHTPVISEFDQLSSLTFDATFNIDLFPSYRVFRSQWMPYLFTFNTDTINFNKVNQGETKTRSFDITNHSTSQVSVTSINTRNKDLSVSGPLPFRIEPGARKSMNVTFSPTKAGYINDTLNVCYETDSTMVNRQIYVTAESVSNTGIESMHRSEAVIYPNPGKGIFNIKTEITKIIRIRVFDIYGRTVIDEKSFNNDSFILNLTDQPDGMYLVELQESDIEIPCIIKIIKFSE